MSSCAEGREELACYALGLLDEAGNLQFEAHLAECSGCARELEDILHTVEDLALVARDAQAMAELAELTQARPRFVPRESVDGFPAAAPATRAALPREFGPHGAAREGTPRPASRPMDEMRPGTPPRRAVWRGRRGRIRLDARRPRRPPAMLVAVVAVVLASVGLAVVLIAPGSDGHNTARADESPIASAAPSTDPGRRYQNTDPRTGVHLDLVVAAGPFGTRLSAELSHVTGPRRCRLVAVAADGDSEVVSGWLVPASGYGTPANPAPLRLTATSSLTVRQLDRVEVREIDPLGRTSVLVAVPVH